VSNKPKDKIDIHFRVAGQSIDETPKGMAILIKQMIEQLGLGEIAKDLEMDKHHGVVIDEIILILLLYSAYGVKSIKQLEEKAKKDKALAEVIEDIRKINNKMLLYFQGRNEISKFEELLDKVIESMQERGRFKSREEGILAVDDSTLAKTGKKMENIEVVFEHGTKQYMLGYVIVVVSYADSEKAYPLNFEFRLRSEDERHQAEIKSKKKKAKIDLRKRGSLLKMIELEEQSGHKPELLEVKGVNIESGTLQQIDEKKITWIVIPNEKIELFDRNNNLFTLEALKNKTKKNKPAELEIQEWKIYSKEVIFKDYGEVECTVVTDMQGNELGIFLLKVAPMSSKTTILQEYFSRQEVADSNKLKIALRGLNRAKDIGIKAETVAGDAWFFIPWFVNKLLKIVGIKRFVSRLKSNCEVYYQGEWLQVKQLWDKVKLHHIHGRFLKVVCLTVKIKGISNPVKVVLFQELDKCFRVKAQYALVCTDTSWSWKKIIQAYKLRWTIECIFRMAKQRHGLQSFHNRKFKKIFCHITFSFLSYLLSARLKICNPKLMELTLGEIIDRYFNCLVTLKRQGPRLLVYMDPVFVSNFGLPCDTS
jgi:hypothetical protein